jgi:hypothetical protein
MAISHYNTFELCIGEYFIAATSKSDQADAGNVTWSSRRQRRLTYKAWGEMSRANGTLGVGVVSFLSL